MSVRRENIDSLGFKTYFYNDDAFNFNYAQAKAHEEKWKEAEEVQSIFSNETISKSQLVSILGVFTHSKRTIEKRLCVFKLVSTMLHIQWQTASRLGTLSQT